MFRITRICRTLWVVWALLGHCRDKHCMNTHEQGRTNLGQLGDNASPKPNKKAHMVSVGLFFMLLFLLVFLVPLV